MSDDRTIKLLEEIRDTQREHLTEYKRVTHELMEIQRQGLKRQEQLGGLYRRVVGVGVVMAAALSILLAYLLIRWAPLLFR